MFGLGLQFVTKIGSNGCKLTLLGSSPLKKIAFLSKKLRSRSRSLSNFVNLSPFAFTFSDSVIHAFISLMHCFKSILIFLQSLWHFLENRGEVFDKSSRKEVHRMHSSVFIPGNPDPGSRDPGPNS